MKKAMLVMSMIVVLGLCGCMVSREPDPTTMPPDTVATQPMVQPTETTTEQTTETLPSNILVITEPDVVITDSVPKYDPNLAEVSVTYGEDNGYFSSMYVQLPSPANGDQRRYGDGVFWFCTDSQEMRQGSHYDTYYLEAGALKKLQNISFRREYTLLGETVTLELAYAVHNGKVLLTYVPVEQSGENYASIVDSSRGPKECLAEFVLHRDEQNSIYYYALVDLETGELTDFLSGFDSKIFETKVFDFVCWDEGNSFVAQQYGGEKNYIYFDVPNLQVIEDYEYDADADFPFAITAYYDDGRCYEIYDPVDDETVLLRLPAKWDDQWYPMDNNRKLVMVKSTGSICQFMIFDADANSLIEVKRKNPNTSDYLAAVSEQEIVLHSNNATVYCFYRFDS